MEEGKISPEQVLEIMLKRDQFTKWLGLEIDSHHQGYCKLHFTVNDDMLNGFDIIHGGILFAASDSAFAFACNSHGMISVALDVTISFARPVKSGERLIVEATELYLGHKIGIYDVRTTNQDGEIVCLFKGTSYRTSKEVS
jgi:acyl-CoA thioesterase